MDDSGDEDYALPTPLGDDSALPNPLLSGEMIKSAENFTCRQSIESLEEFYAIARQQAEILKNYSDRLVVSKNKLTSSHLSFEQRQDHPLAKDCLVRPAETFVVNLEELALPVEEEKPKRSTAADIFVAFDDSISKKQMPLKLQERRDEILKRREQRQEESVVAKKAQEVPSKRPVSGRSQLSSGRPNPLSKQRTDTMGITADPSESSIRSQSQMSSRPSVQQQQSLGHLRLQSNRSACNPIAATTKPKTVMVNTITRGGFQSRRPQQQPVASTTSRVASPARNERAKIDRLTQPTQSSRARTVAQQAAKPSTPTSTTKVASAVATQRIAQRQPLRTVQTSEKQVPDSTRPVSRNNNPGNMPTIATNRAYNFRRNTIANVQVQNRPLSAQGHTNAANRNVTSTVISAAARRMVKKLAPIEPSLMQPLRDYSAERLHVETVHLKMKLYPEPKDYLLDMMFLGIDCLMEEEEDNFQATEQRLLDEFIKHEASNVAGEQSDAQPTESSLEKQMNQSPGELPTSTRATGGDVQGGTYVRRRSTQKEPVVSSSVEQLQQVDTTTPALDSPSPSERGVVAEDPRLGHPDNMMHVSMDSLMAPSLAGTYIMEADQTLASKGHPPVVISSVECIPGLQNATPSSNNNTQSNRYG